MSMFKNEPPRVGRIPRRIGVLLANLGTPDAPTAPALRRFLREFLGDPRVIEEPRWKWWPILNLFILPFRPRQSAALYRKVWTDEGSPLLNLSLSLAEKVQQDLDSALEQPVEVVTGMRYGSPSISDALTKLRLRGCRQLFVLPLFPQYSGTTTASIFDAVFAELTSWRVVPDLRTIQGYHDNESYIEAVAGSIREAWRRDGQPDKLLLSFHGIPERYSLAGDPYYHQCLHSAQLVREVLGLDEKRCLVSFQSIFGREEWIKPPTDKTIEGLAKDGVKRLDVVCPGFSVDCLETLEEIDQLNREIFLDNGGQRFRYIPCLNNRSSHAATIVDLVRRNLGDWIEPSEHLETGEERWSLSAS